MGNKIKSFFTRYYDDIGSLIFGFMLIRIVMGLIFGAGVVVFWKLNILDYNPTAIVFLILPVYFAVNFSWFFLGKIKILRKIILDSQLVVDIIFITLIIHYSGGPHSDMFFLYVFPVISAIVIAPFAPLAAGLTALLFYGSLLYLEHLGIVSNIQDIQGIQHLGLQNDEKIRVGIFVMLISVLNFQTIYLMNLVKKKEEEIVKIKDEFISIASHQLKTPVASINWLIELFKKSLDGELDEKQKGIFGQISDSIGGLDKLVNDLLDLSRMKLGTNVKNIQEINLSRFIRDFVNDIMPYADSKGKKILFDTKDDLSITSDPKMLYDILGNLVTNAIKYSPIDSPVIIDFKKEGSFVRIAVVNRGPVIPEDEQKHLFEKFFRGESGRIKETEGTGLGLYIVKIYVENLGGKVGFDSEDRRTEFWFTLPISNEKRDVVGRADR
ncbi:MAG: hypothetical protein A2655_04515 [Candidatus Yanofskybacteria bacterium RIFCSPHIGHO2_01_FULL_43_42]|uniref:histidine kinase n=1 Tax=Candidatus Yanofskybacteria bacterium RIFCSPLOWO2_01_FULL_43_22 TaxID=1802695 RepID=A0A1F8GDC0_9BACT|nr:MAG: hypothetical protein A2655_04515 [Candidatus Yanofskybacteria bacterium RIFCSPHIGHO2_01_FULL_43_42]OGN13520.1 MAG: hypothetical protein A3D48_02075 [Candidatus Yanofskybacteria bacterium RIFCSPHIGHO2_02_FULL_43_17]OGN23375.1 MAG: hypothetical protein A3A13_04640 [Candidatus Yanofskybacteria bacterium RIFCSPLOWO2_01_FULL_43_22]